jgi:hypothetical protein
MTEGSIFAWKRMITSIMSLLAFCISLPVTRADAAIFDRVVAFVDNQAITLSEFEEQLANTRKVSPGISPKEVIDTMINRQLLLREARKYRIEGPSEDDIVREYIDLKVRAFITVGESQIEAFYRENQDRFAGSEYETVRGEIERYLTEREVNTRLKETIKDLRQKAYIKVQLE